MSNPVTRPTSPLSSVEGAVPAPLLPLGLLLLGGLLPTVVSAGEWEPAVVIDNGQGYAHHSALAVTPSGGSHAAWLASDGASASLQVYANSAAGGSWGTPNRLNLTVIEAHDLPISIAASESGGAITAWHRAMGTSDSQAYANQRSGGQWSAPVPLEGSSQPEGQMSVVMDDAGQGLVTWMRQDDFYGRLYSSRWTGSTWASATPTRVDSCSATEYVAQAHLAGNRGGQAVAVWGQISPQDALIYANRWSGGAWQGAELVGPGAGNPGVGDVRAAINSTGGAVAVWQQSDTAEFILAASIWDGAQWSSAMQISGSAGYSAYEPRVGIADSGDILIVWRQSDGYRDRIWARQRIGGVWGNEQVIDQNQDSVAALQLAMNGAGKAMVLWRMTPPQGSSTPAQIQARRWNGSSWEAVREIAPDNGDTPLAPQVAMDVAGDAYASWEQGGRLYAAHFNRNLGVAAECSGSTVTVQNRLYQAGERILCRATTQLTTAGSVSVESGATVYYQGPALRLTPGFAVKAGGHLHATP